MGIPVSLIGIATSILSFILFSRDNFTPRTTRRLLLTMTMVDILFLLGSFFYLMPHEALRKSEALLLTLSAFVNILEMVRNWIVVLICLERYIITCYPLQAKKWLRLSYTNTAIGICVFLSAITRIPLMVFLACDSLHSLHVEANKLLKLVHATMDAVVMTLIPLSILGYCSLRIFHCIRNSDVFRQKISSVPTSKSPSKCTRCRPNCAKVTRVLLVVIIVFAVLMLPLIPVNILTFDWYKMGPTCSIYISQRLLNPLSVFVTNFIIYKRYRTILLQVSKRKHWSKISIRSKSSSCITDYSLPPRLLISQIDGMSKS
ncbi:unnamed protein product [Hymenolepis diminuta]|uniref:G-protein coupled receptors family 1 profile domain-containing protein n=1 Tax=Hymenolepis diminuta TaxID=6216 RepID=A0A3P6ZPC6_HYMDI|nr:unnamed protein product [Hymenolepis diminuta]